MKIKCCIIGSLCLCMGALCSCSEAENVKFSCDDTVDEWVKENLDDIRLMGRAEWLQTNSVLKAAVLRAFTPEQKEAFWRNKIQETLELNWTQEERSHIQKLIKFIDQYSELFSMRKLTEEQEDFVDMFFYKWQEEGLQQCGWDSTIGLAIAVSGYPLKNTAGELLVVEDSVPYDLLASTESDCECQQYVNLCMGGTYCKQGNCTELNSGCGFLTMGSCTGMCEPK